MPELPEVHTTVDGIKNEVVGKTRFFNAANLLATMHGLPPVTTP